MKLSSSWTLFCTGLDGFTGKYVTTGLVLDNVCKQINHLLFPSRAAADTVVNTSAVSIIFNVTPLWKVLPGNHSVQQKKSASVYHLIGLWTTDGSCSLAAIVCYFLPARFSVSYKITWSCHVSPLCPNATTNFNIFCWDFVLQWQIKTYFTFFPLQKRKEKKRSHSSTYLHFASTSQYTVKIIFTAVSSSISTSFVHVYGNFSPVFTK